jgi:type I restriction enzyme S subunit
VVQDSEREVEVLRDRLVKANAIKRGMMQELLTGRTRLVVSEAVA